MGLWPITWAFGLITIQFMDYLGRPQGRYPNIFMLISLLKVSRRGVLDGHLGFLIRDLEDRVILDVMVDVFLS